MRFFFFLLLISTSQLKANDLPDIGSASDSILSPSQEARIGRLFLQNLLNHYHVISDLEIQSYIQSLGNRLAINSEAPENEYSFFVILNQEVNAFAGPGGHIGVFSGLFSTTQSEGELASVLAHEITHVSQKHLLRTLSNNQSLSLAAAVGLIAAVLLGSQSPDLVGAAVTAVTAGSQQMQLNFSRQNENEADRIGIKMLSKSEFNPHDMVSFFEKMQRHTRYYGGKIPEYLRSHPVTMSRIADAQIRVGQYQQKTRYDSLAYHLIRAKLKLLSMDDEKALQYFKSIIDDARYYYKEAADYGYGLALIKAGRYTEARNVFKDLLINNNNQAAYWSGLAHTFEQNDEQQIKIKLLINAQKIFPDNKALLYQLVITQLRLNQYDLAFDTVKTHLKKTLKTPPVFYKLAAKAADLANKQMEKLFYIAKYYQSTGELLEAINQVKLAMALANLSFYQKSRLEDLLMQLKKAHLQQKKDQKL